MEQIEQLLAQHGLALVFLNVMLTQAGLPVPAVPVLLIAGAYLHLGELSLLPLLATAVAASLLGDLPWYFAGRRYGTRMLDWLCRLAVEPAVCVERTSDRLARWGAPALAVAKFVPGFATVAPPLAGASRIPLAAFLGYSAIGAGLWAGTAIAAGVLFRAQIARVVAAIDAAGVRAALVVGALLGAYVVIKFAQRWWFMRTLRMARVTPSQLSRMLEAATPPIVLDARSAMAREAQPGIPGAWAVDLDVPEKAMVDVPPDRDVVIYCS